MKTLTMLLLLAVVVMLSGCGLFSGPDNYESYQKMYSSFAESKTARGNAMTSTPCPEDPVAAAYCNSSKMMGQAFISLERFDINAPKTGYDVLYKATDSIVPVSGFYALYKLGVSGVEGAGATFGNDNTLTNSMNHTNPTTTNIGSGSATSNTSGTMPPAEPVIVEPSYPPVEAAPVL